MSAAGMLDAALRDDDDRPDPVTWAKDTRYVGYAYNLPDAVSREAAADERRSVDA